MRLERSLRFARYVFGLAAAAFLILAFARAWQDARGRVLPSPVSIVAGSAALLVALRCAISSWTVLFEGTESQRTLAYYFLMAQFGKYIPGGFWQLIGQVGLASQAGATLARASSALPVHLAVQAAAGGTIGALAGFLQPATPLVWRAIAFASAGLVLLLNRRLMTAVMRRVRWRGVPAVLGGDIPSQRAIWQAYWWATATLLCSGTAFALLISSVDPTYPPATYAAVFALAWLAGFLAVPVPSGLGVREAVMLVFLPAGSGTVIAASICHRLIGMAAESAILGMTRARLK